MTSSSFAAACPALASYISSSRALLPLSEATATKIFQLMLFDGQSCQQHHGYVSSNRHLQEDNGVSSSPIVNVVLVIVCLISAAMASGLTQGLLSLDLMETKIIARSGTLLLH